MHRVGFLCAEESHWYNKNMFISDNAAALYTQKSHDQIVASNATYYIIPLRDRPEEERPREKLAKFGPEILTTAELVAILLGQGTKKEEVLHMSQRLLKEYGEQAIIRERDPKKLAAALDIPPVKAAQLVAAFELGRRFFKNPASATPVLRTARQVFAYVRDMRDLPKEHLRGIYLDAHYRVVHDEVISVGSLTANIVHPREVFKPALQYPASAVILVHNHPSGLAGPSAADIEVTEQLVAAGKILGVNLLDHVIVTKNKFMSVPAAYL